MIVSILTNEIKFIFQLFVFINYHILFYLIWDSDKGVTKVETRYFIERI